MNWFGIASGIIAAVGPAALPPSGPNVLVIILDDARWDDVQWMPLLDARATESGIRFENAFVSNPLCCPSRASFLSGGFYAKNHQVLTNERPNGSAYEFVDTDTIATRLQAAGYRTGLVGKYLNLYPASVAFSSTPIPPGWSTFAAWGNQPNWYDWSLWTGSSTATARGAGAKVTGTGSVHVELENRATNFIAGSEPWFLLFAPFAPHKPTTPDEQDENEYTNYVYDERGYWEADVGDKPTYVQVAAQNATEGQEHARNRLRCLLMADRVIDSLLDSLPENTVALITSDNGYMLGEHRLFDKGVPYEESIRVPLIVFAPGFGPDSKGQVVSADVDIARTIFDLAGVAGPAADGISIRPIYESNTDGRDYAYAQSWYENDVPGWTMIHAGAMKYVSLDTDEEEFYDIAADPYELENAIDDSCYAEFLPWFRSEAASMRGLSMKTPSLPQPSVGVAYSAALTAWGGATPHTWAVASGSLPGGLSLSGDTISGTPTTAQTRTFTIRVSDANGKRESREFQLTVLP